MLNKYLVETIKELYKIPNAPFSVSARTEYVVKKLQDAGCEVEDTPYFVRGFMPRNTGRKRLFFISHLDHPGFVFKNSEEAIAFGSLYLDRVKRYKPINVYTQAGEYLGKVEIEKVFGKDYSRVKVKSDFDIPKNSQGLWEVGEVKFDGQYIYGLSHDNDILSVVLLSLLPKLTTEALDIHIVFTKHEEVLQMSSYNLAKNNSLGISEEDIIVNLDSMKVYPIIDNPQFSKLTYDGGLVLNVSEATMIYGKGGAESRNFSESLINNIANQVDVNLQTGLAGGTSDARPLSYFGLTDNISTLNVPNRYKHNSDGESIVYEHVKVSDVKDLYKIIHALFSLKKVPNISENPNDISPLARVLYPNFAREAANFYSNLNKRLDIVFRNVIKRGYYFPVTFYEVVVDFVLRGLSYLAVSRRKLNKPLSAE